MLASDEKPARQVAGSDDLMLKRQSREERVWRVADMVQSSSSGHLAPSRADRSDGRSTFDNRLSCCSGENFCLVPLTAVRGCSIRVHRISTYPITSSARS